MWIVLFVFFLGLLLLGFLLYGLQQWDTLLTDEDPAGPASTANRLPPGRVLPLWLLLIGLGGYSILDDLLAWWAPGILP